ncbi:MAG TPA: nucleotide disphospho-sugar-binding domain-containing protein [Puia sp.]|jgi:MGT family glycosyltransferase|nr:nucleotide disphospho-sugar-binding domain-containing protein [Puia sp.]
MALIAFLMDIEEGHLLPSFSLAHSLKRFGHDIVYLSVPDNEEQIRKQGFGFVAILEDIYPKGFNQRLKEFVRRKGIQRAKIDREHMGALTDELVESVFKTVKPGLIIVSCFLHVEALVLFYKFKVQPVIFTPYIRDMNSSIYQDCIDEIMDMSGNKAMRLIELAREFGVKAGSLSQLAGPLNDFCEVVACSDAIAVADRPASANFHYIGPSVFRLTEADNGPIPGSIGGDKRVIYASMGSQVTSYGDTGRRVLEMIINVMKFKEMSGMHLILAIGPEHELNEFGSVPENVTLMKWVPQTEILKVASLAITHGGLGTVKECIYYGVPMIVIPISRDQPSNARRVEACKLGIQLKPGEVTEPELFAAIRNVLGNDMIGDSVIRMQKVFRKQEESDLGAHIIEGLLEVKGGDKVEVKGGGEVEIKGSDKVEVKGRDKVKI